MHTKDMLADELEKAGCHAAAKLAREGYYHDFLSPLDSPMMQLVEDLAKVGTPEAMALRQRAMDGDFDANEAEAKAWAASQDGQEAFGKLIEKSPGEMLEGEFQSFVAASFPGGLRPHQLADIRRIFFGGALVLFNTLGREVAAHDGLRPEFIAAVGAKFDALTVEFHGGMQ